MYHINDNICIKPVIVVYTRDKVEITNLVNNKVQTILVVVVMVVVVVVVLYAVKPRTKYLWPLGAEIDEKFEK